MKTRFSSENIEADVFELYDKEDAKSERDLYEDQGDYEEEEYSDEEFYNFSINPEAVFDKENRLDYVELMKDYHSDNPRLREKAKEAIVNELTGFVLYIIKKRYPSYTSRYYDDLVQCGMEGILIGLKEYDPSKGQPSTYFYPFIVHELQEFINQTVYKTTPYYSVTVKKINKIIAQFETMNISYSARDISIQTDLPLNTVEKTLRIMNGNSEASLDFCSDKVEGPDYYDPVSEYLKKESIEFLYKTMKECLTEEEALIMAYLHGVGDLDALPLKAIAQKMNISLDRVKKLKTLAYCKLRNSPLAQFRPSSYRNDIMDLEYFDSDDSFAVGLC